MIFLYCVYVRYSLAKNLQKLVLTPARLTYFVPLVSFDTPENIRKPKVFWYCQRVSKETSGIKWVKDEVTLILNILNKMDEGRIKMNKVINSKSNPIVNYFNIFIFSKLFLHKRSI